MPSTLPGAERAPPERGSVSLGVTCMLSRVAWMQPWHPPRHSPNQTRVRIELLNTDPEAAHQNHLGRPNNGRGWGPIQANQTKTGVDLSELLKQPR